MIQLRRSIADLQRLAWQVLAATQAPGSWDWFVEHMVIPSRRIRIDPQRHLPWRHWHHIVTARLHGRYDPADPWAHRTEEIYLCAASQVYKSTFLHSVFTYCLKHHPRKMALFMDRKSDLTKARRGKLEPILEAVQELNDLLPRTDKARERALGAELWLIAAAQAYFLSGSVANDWRSQDFSLMLCDEIEQYPDDVEGEGDPIDLGLVRQRTYRHERLLIGASSPGRLDGHTWRRLCSGSHERLLISCSACQGVDYIADAQMHLAGERALAEVEPHEIRQQDLGRWACRHCGQSHDGTSLAAMIHEAALLDQWCPGTWQQTDEQPQGLWTPHADLDEHGRLRRIHPAEGLIRSGWLSAVYNPYDTPLSEFIAKKAAAEQGTEENKKTFRNTEAAEFYIFTTQAANADELHKAAAGGYRIGSLPTRPDQLVLVIDQQGNRPDDANFPWVLRGFWRGAGSALVDTGHAQSIDELQDVEDRLWPVGNEHRGPDLVVMDSGNGNMAFWIYAWASRDRGRRVCLRGSTRLPWGVPWQQVEPTSKSRRTTPKPPDVREWRVNPHHYRSIVWDRLSHAPGAAPFQLPDDPPRHYLRSLTSEEMAVELRTIPGAGRQEMIVWNPRVTSRTDRSVVYRRDTHWWHCEAMAAAIADIMGWQHQPEPRPNPAPPPPRHDSDWLAGFANTGADW